MTPPIKLCVPRHILEELRQELHGVRDHESGRGFIWYGRSSGDAIHFLTEVPSHDTVPDRPSEDDEVPNEYIYPFSKF